MGFSKPIQIIGTYSYSSNIWRWGDENPDYDGSEGSISLIKEIRSKKEFSDVGSFRSSGQEIEGRISGYN